MSTKRSSSPPESGFLAAIARTSRERACKLRARSSFSQLLRTARALPEPPKLALLNTAFDLVAEVKFASPSTGALARASAAQAGERAACYARSGACAVSVLTEPSRFRGALGHLRAAAAASRTPVMRKDFLVDVIQVAEARAAGAAGVLLVLRLLDGPTLISMLETCAALGLFALLEAFDQRDLERAGAAAERTSGAVQCLVGVNARDLATLAVDRERCLRLAPHLPPGIPAVAESGIESPEDARAAARAGYRLALVGAALTRARDPEVTIRSLLAAGRAGRLPCW